MPGRRPSVSAASAVALNSIGTVANGFDVFRCTINGVASRQCQHRAAQYENFQKPCHSLSPTARANCPPLETTDLRNERSIAQARAGQSVQNARSFEEKASRAGRLLRWPSWDAALLETIDALHDDPYLAAGLALPLGQRCTVADYVALA